MHILRDNETHCITCRPGPIRVVGHNVTIGHCDACRAAAAEAPRWTEVLKRLTDR